MTDEMILVPRAELLAWAKEWLYDHDPNDGTDCVTPFDTYLLKTPVDSHCGTATVMRTNREAPTMTADKVEMLPLYAELQGHPKLEIIKHYARAVAEHNVKARDAEIEALRAEVDALRDALRQIAEWPDGGNRYGQEKIKGFARAVLDWIRMSDRRPTVDDADESGTVWVYDRVFEDVSSVHFSRADSPYYTHWMSKEKRPAPPAPKENNS